MQSSLDSDTRETIPRHWQVPDFEASVWRDRVRRWCVVIPVLDEGERIRALLEAMSTLRVADAADIIIVDGGSNDDSLDSPMLQGLDVRAKLRLTGPPGLSSQLRCGYAFALSAGYEGVVTIDGNNKDDPEAIPAFLAALDQGVHFAQASRFIRGGVAENTPRSRTLAIRLVHAPLLSLFSRHHWTDTTQGFRGYRREVLEDPRVQPFRDVFQRYELLAYMSCRVPRLGYTCIELPTTRRYPKGAMPTKIRGLQGNLLILSTAIRACLGRLDPT